MHTEIGPGSQEYLVFPRLYSTVRVPYTPKVELLNPNLILPYPY